MLILIWKSVSLFYCLEMLFKRCYTDLNEEKLELSVQLCSYTKGDR